VLETDTDGQAEQIRDRLQRSVEALDRDLAPEARRHREDALRQEAQDATSFRDATDRAAALADERSAVSMMGRAIRSDDAVLARAVAAEANARNWREPLELWARQGNGNLELADLARELDSPPKSRERASRIFRWRI